MEKIIEKAGREMSYKINRYIRLKLKPKPWYLPTFIWKGLLRRLIVLEELEKML